jgi:hypothetical protein
MYMTHAHSANLEDEQEGFVGESSFMTSRIIQSRLGWLSGVSRLIHLSITHGLACTLVGHHLLGPDL